MHIPITRTIRSIVDESLVHCQRGCEFEHRHRTLFLLCVFLSILYLYQFIYLFVHVDIIHNIFKTIWFAGQQAMHTLLS